MNLLFLGLIIQILSIFGIAFFKNDRKASAISHIILIIGIAVGLTFTIQNLMQGVPSFVNYNLFRVDALSSYFLLIIQLVSIPTSIYSYSYLKHHIDKGDKVRSNLLFFIVMLISTQLVVIADNAIFFLVCWELMSMSSYLGMIMEKEKKEVQSGSFYYLIACHAIVLFLYVFFLLLHHQTNSWLISDFHISPKTGNLFIILYALSLIGFGTKAGFMPFHVWLPKAHPIAPTVFSAFLSGVIIKMGIYGILRTFQILNPTPEWLGWVVLGVSMISAIFGVWYALAQHDIKKLLAYHSIENIGIIGIGIGIGFIGSAYHSLPVQILGFGGALLHTLNHAIFKSLLFIGSGVIYQNLGTRNIELMGGLIHKSRIFVILFLIGSIAICGIPPLNGFISEFIIYNGFFRTAKELGNYYPIIMLFSAVGLAFVGGLAVACFTKLNSVMFLGSERKKVDHFNVSLYDYLSMGILAAFCIIIGFYPYPFIKIVNSVLGNGFVPFNSYSVLTNINWLMISLIFSGIVLVFALLYLWKHSIQKKYGQRNSDAWGCGYEGLDPRMQYTASSFADELNVISQSVLVYQKQEVMTDRIIPVDQSFESHSKDIIDDKFIIPGLKKLTKMISKIKIFNYSDIRYYVASVLITIIIYCIIAFIWK
ncbi:MAG: proton-conducting transporter membrane subunit [bacterium]